jgi:putative two-component system response regulator
LLCIPEKRGIMDINMSLMVYDGQKSNSGHVPACNNENYEVCTAEPEETGCEPQQTADQTDIIHARAMISEEDDISFLSLVKEYYPEIVKIFPTGQGSLKNSVEPMDYPAMFSYLTKLWSSRDMGGIISKSFGPYRFSLKDYMLQRLTYEQTEELSLINANLKNILNAQIPQLLDFIRDGIIMLATFAEAREDNTGGHIFRIRELVVDICEGLELPSCDIEEISFSSMMHDVGKIRISDAVLLKAGPLNEEERMIMQKHCEIGERMLGDKSTYRTAREIARSHHERWDGSGYPDGLKGDSIPLPARITAIADAFDALTHERCYKKTWPVGMAVREMKALSGKHFDPSILDVFCRIQSGEINKSYMAKEISEQGT